jgi:hypothetical protein
MQNDLKNFFVEISKDDKNQTLLVETLVAFTTKINQMKAAELIALFQALQMLRIQFPKPFFGENIVRANIESTQLVVVQAMQSVANQLLDLNLTNRFNNVINGIQIGGSYYTIED